MFLDPRGNEMSLTEAEAQVGPGWSSLIRRLWIYFQDRQITVNQIKEKFGGLRFYVANATDLDYETIDQAEKDSLHLCEVCGAIGKPRVIGGWISTLCDEHAKAREAAWQK